MVRLVTALMVPSGVEDGFCLWWASLNAGTCTWSLWCEKSLKYCILNYEPEESQAWYILQCLAYYCHSITLINIFAFDILPLYSCHFIWQIDRIVAIWSQCRISQWYQSQRYGHFRKLDWIIKKNVNTFQSSQSHCENISNNSVNN